MTTSREQLWVNLASTLNVLEAHGEDPSAEFGSISSVHGDLWVEVGHDEMWHAWHDGDSGLIDLSATP